MSGEYLRLGTVSLNTQAFKPRDLIPLLGRSSRGSNRVLPGAYGQRPYVPHRDQIDVTIEWICNGAINTGGSAFVNSPGTTLYANLSYYKAAFLDQGNGSTGLTAATLYLQNGTRTGSVQVWDWSPYWTSPSTATVVTRMVVPDGDWT